MSSDRQDLVSGTHDSVYHSELNGKVSDLVKALGCDTRISKSSMSRICKAIDADVTVLGEQQLDHIPFVYLWLAVTYVHVREHHQVVSKAVVIATGLRADGRRAVIRVDVGDSENESLWTEFLRDLKDRGLTGARLITSDAHAGLRAAIRQVFQGADWKRCRVHAMRNLLGAAPTGIVRSSLRRSAQSSFTPT